MTRNKEVNQVTRTGLYWPGQCAEVERSTLQLLLANEEARAILSKHIPGLLDAPQLSMAPRVFTDEVMQGIVEESAQLSPVAASDLPEPPKLSLWQPLLARLASWRLRRPSWG